MEVASLTTLYRGERASMYPTMPPLSYNLDMRFVRPIVRPNRWTTIRKMRQY